jgi:membrane dipeptidase
MIALSFFCLLVLLLLAGVRFTKALANPVRSGARIEITPQIRVLHRQLFIADMHADSLLYKNSLLVRSRQGHVDLPRLIEGNVAIQVFTCVSKFPLAANIDRNSSKVDLITLLAVLQGWPRDTWSSLYRRAIYQADKLKATVHDSNGELSLLKNRQDLSDFIARRGHDPAAVGAILGLEGGQVLEGRLENLNLLYQAGFRLLSPTHFFDNELGGSMHGMGKNGLTSFGCSVIRRMQELDMLVDLAHASYAMMDDVLAVIDRPVLVSHTGIRGICDNNRNLSDEYLRKIASNGGLVGIGFWNTATGSGDTLGIARSIRYAVDLIGIEHVGIGSDFDGSVQTPFDVSGIVQLTAALLQLGFNPAEVKQVMGGNFYAFLQHWLPAESCEA